MSLLNHSLGDGSEFRCSLQTSSSTLSNHNYASCWGDDTTTNGLCYLGEHFTLVVVYSVRRQSDIQTVVTQLEQSLHI